MSEPDFASDIEKRPVVMKKITLSEFILLQSQAGNSEDDFEPQQVSKKPKKSLKRRVKDVPPTSAPLPPAPAAAITAPKVCDINNLKTKYIEIMLG